MLGFMLLEHLGRCNSLLLEIWLVKREGGRGGEGWKGEYLLIVNVLGRENDYYFLNLF